MNLNVYCVSFFVINLFKNWITTAEITIDPPIKTEIGGFSFTNIQAQRGPKTASVNIIIPTKAEGVDLAPIVIKIKPNPTWKIQLRNPKKYPMMKPLLMVIKVNQ